MPKTSKEKVDKKQDKQIKKIMRELRPEIKTFQSNNGLVTVTNTGTITYPTLLAQGVAISQRVGLEQNHYAFEERLYLDNAVAAPHVVRVIYFLWKDALSAGVPVVTDILQSANAYSVYNRNIARKSRYQIISDKTYHLGSNANGQDAAFSMDNKVYLFKKLRHKAASYIGASNATSDAGEGHLCRLVIGSNPGITTSWGSSFCYRYTDS